MNNKKLILTLIYFLFFLSCIQDTNKNQEEIPNSRLNETKFLSKEGLSKYRDEANSIKFQYQNFGFHDSLKFNKIIAYEFDLDIYREEEGVLSRENIFSTGIKRQHQLDYNEIELLLSIFTSKEHFGGMSALCFNPKLGFVFYYDTEVVNVIDICLDCNIVLGRRRFLPFEPFYTEKNKDYKRFSTAFNRKGFERIIELCGMLDFEYANFKIEEDFF